MSRLNARDLYRCSNCNASFRRLNLLKLTAMAVVLLGLLSAATYFAVTKLGGAKTSTTSPRIRNKQLPPAKPPVFR